MWASAKRPRSPLFKLAAAREKGNFSLNISFALNISLPAETGLGDSLAIAPQAPVVDAVDYRAAFQHCRA
jgi:hypothetical protein